MAGPGEPGGMRPTPAVCVFCGIVAGREPATVLYEWAAAIAIVPRHPVVPGHVLVIPRGHVVDAADDPHITGLAAECVAEWGQWNGEPFNLITSCGEAATQTQFHLHWHYVPRSDGDGLTLPWTGQVVS